jgi:hypothetical protein
MGMPVLVNRFERAAANLGVPRFFIMPQPARRAFVQRLQQI